MTLFESVKKNGYLFNEAAYDLLADPLKTNYLNLFFKRNTSWACPEAESLTLQQKC